MTKKGSVLYRIMSVCLDESTNTNVNVVGIDVGTQTEIIFWDPKDPHQKYLQQNQINQSVSGISAQMSLIAVQTCMSL